MDTFQSIVDSGIATDSSAPALEKYSRDTSIFERRPRLIVMPKSAQEVAKIITLINEGRTRGESIALAPRAAGTDMTGGPLTDSIVLSFTENLNHIIEIAPGYVVSEPGVFYRDLEKATLDKTGCIIPSYPASRALCALGGMLGNNSGGELTLRYGKTADYVQSLDVVLSDGSQTTIRPLNEHELAEKEKLNTLEGSIYRAVHELIRGNRDEIAANKPVVSKNSAGYALWDVWNDATGLFDLTRLLIGSQGTLAVITSARLKLVQLKKNRAMLVMFLKDIHDLPEAVHRVMKFNPESFESYDDHTFRLAVRFLPQIIGQLGIIQMLRLGFAFLPELRMVLTGGVPKLVLMAEFAEDTAEEAREKAKEARLAISDLPVKAKIAREGMDAKKYWIIRRESFSLLRKNLRGYYASPFIDDLVVPIESYPEFIPALNKLLKEYDLIYTIAGHIGNGNFHIIPLMNLADPHARQTILELTPKVYELVKKFHGSTTGEHNDGLIRTPYLNAMFSPKMLDLFKQIKTIFDPNNIFNPGKKVGATEEDIKKFMITHK